MRVNIKLSEEMDDKVCRFAKSFGMSKSSFMAYCIGSHIRTLEKSDDVVDSIKNCIRSELATNNIN